MEVLGVQDFQSLGHIGYVDPNAYVPAALPEWLAFLPRLQASARQLVHRLAQPQMPLPAQALRCGGDVWVEVNGRTHTIKASIMMREKAHH